MSDNSYASGRSGTHQRGRLTLLTYSLTAAYGFAIAAIGPALPSLREDLAISKTVGGLHFTALALGGVLTGLVVERIVGWAGRRNTFWWGGVGVGLGSLLIGTGWHPVITLLGALGVGASGVPLLATSIATVADLHPTHRATVLTEVNTAMSAGTVVPALLIGVAIASGLGWQPAFLIPALVWLVLFLIHRSVRFPAAQAAEANGATRSLPRTYWIFWAGIVPAVAAEWSIAAWGATYLVDVVGRSEGSASLLMTAFFAAMVVGRILGARLTRTLKPVTLLLASAAIGLGGFLLFWASEPTASVVAGLLIAGLGTSMLFPMLLSLAMETAPGQPELVSGRLVMGGSGAVLVAPLTLGAIADQAGIRVAFSVVPGLFLLTAASALVGHRALTRSGDTTLQT